MKKLLQLVGVIAVIFVWQLSASSCTKTNTKTVTVIDTVTVTQLDTVILYPIEGLWIGSYNSAANGSTAYYFSFTVYPDSTLTYRSNGANNTSFTAIGTWSLSGTAFTFSVVANNGDTQTGTAVYSKTAGTLTSGTISNPLGGPGGTWTMNKIN